MFRNWGFLLTEIWLLLAIAALIGLFAGWLIWGRRPVVVTGGAVTPAADTAGLRTALNSCEAERGDLSRRIAGLEADLAEAEARAAAAGARALALEAAPAQQPVSPPPAVAQPVAAPAPAPLAGLAPATEKVRPVTLDAARAGGPDNLKLIKGIGPKMEALCHRLGFYHFDQIAAWTPAELAWVDDNLEDFKGRATRDNWIGQARDLAAGKPPLPGGEH